MSQINSYFSVQFDGQSYCPSKCICVGRNYIGHINEMGSKRTEHAVLFNKPNSAIASQLYASHDNEALQFETELCFLMVQGQPVAIGIGLDLTKRTLQRQLKQQGLPWEKSKSFNGSAVFSPFVTIPNQLDDIHFCLHVDNKKQQNGTVENMIFSLEEIVCEISTFQHLYDGDIVMSGTPQGVGDVTEGSNYQVSLFNGEGLLMVHNWIAKPENIVE